MYCKHGNNTRDYSRNWTWDLFPNKILLLSRFTATTGHNAHYISDMQIETHKLKNKLDKMVVWQTPITWKENICCLKYCKCSRQVAVRIHYMVFSLIEKHQICFQCMTMAAPCPGVARRGQYDNNTHKCHYTLAYNHADSHLLVIFHSTFWSYYQMLWSNNFLFCLAFFISLLLFMQQLKRSGL